MHDLGRARAPLTPLAKRLYESHYLTAVDPDGGRALWVRHTTLKRPGDPGRPTTWVVWSDASAGPPQCHRVTDPGPLPPPTGVLSASAHGTLARDRASGELEGIGWELTWKALAGELPYLPARWLYDRAVPRSNGAALVPAASVDGTVSTPTGATVTVGAWDGMVGHNWGTEHAEQWSWLHAGGLGEDRTGWLDLVLVRVRVGPLLTPWIASGAVHLGGRTYVPGRRGPVQRVVDGDRAQVGLTLAGGARLELEITSPGARTAEWDYASPGGRGRLVRNCLISDAALTLHTDAGRQDITLGGRFAAEHGAPA